MMKKKKTLTSLAQARTRRQTDLTPTLQIAKARLKPRARSVKLKRILRLQ